MNEENNKTEETPKGIIHIILSYAYFLFLIAIILGVVFDHIFNLKIVNNASFPYIGMSMIFIGSALVYWAQRSTKVSKDKINDERNIEFFAKGPYKYTRNPTHFGLFVMSLGLGFLFNSIFSLVLVIITHFVVKYVFLKRQDKILEERYGENFSSYKNKVKDLL